eukprot:gene12495-14667_t
MHSTTHLAPILWSKLRDGWTSLASRYGGEAYGGYSQVGLPEEFSGQTSRPLSREEVALRLQPNVHHPHPADGRHTPFRTPGDRIREMEALQHHNTGNIIRTTIGNPGEIWRETLDKGAQFLSQLEEKIDDTRDNIIAKVYGTEFDYKERLKKEIEENLKIFKETNSRMLEEWNKVYDNPEDRLQEMKVRAREEYREGRERAYQTTQEFLGPLGVQG